MKFTVSALLLTSIFISTNCYFIDYDRPIIEKPTCKHYEVGGECLSFSEEPASWKDAEERCWEKNGHLATLADPIAFMIYVNHNYPGKIFWLGATDFAQEGIWRWINDIYFTRSFPWVAGEPNNHDGKQHCLNWGGVSYNGYQTFDDGNCDDSFQYVCEHFARDN